MATIRDVARQAAVSVSTVSLVFSQPHRVAEKTRLRIQKTAEDLGYRPNGTARDLRNRKTNTIAVLLHNLSGPFYSELIRGVEEVADTLGFTTIAAGCSRNKGQGSIRLLHEARVDGAIVLDPSIESLDLLRYADKSLPVVVLDRPLSWDFKSPYITAVAADNELGGYLAGQHLIARGYRRFGFIAGPVDSEDSRLRHMGFYRALHGAAVDTVTLPVVHSDFTEPGGMRAMAALLDKGWGLDAVFAANDEMAIGALHVLEERHIKVPDAMAVMGFDDIRLARYVTPPLSTIHQPMYELGQSAMRTLEKALAGDTGISVPALPVTLVVRASTVPSRNSKEGDAVCLLK